MKKPASPLLSPHREPGLAGQADSFDFITRYFLRRLAMARRKQHVNPATPYTEAKVEVILLVLGLPIVAIVSFVLIGSLRWLSPAEAATFPLPPKYVLAIAIWGVCVLVGNLWLNRKFRKYREDPTPCFDFDTEHDRRIVRRQKATMLVLCGFVIPAIAFFISFWSRL